MDSGLMNEILFGRKVMNEDNEGDDNGNDDDDDLYEIMGCQPTSTDDQIMAEYRARALTLHPDKCGPQYGKQFYRLQRAKEILLDHKRRRDYDRWRTSGLSITYRRWTHLKQNGTLHGSMHWMSSSSSNKIPALLDSADHSETSNQATQAERDEHFHFFNSEADTDSSMLKQFRSYQI